MTGNKAMQHFQNMLLPIFGYVMEKEKEYQPASISHIDLVEPLEGSSKEKFRQEMIQHLKFHFDSIT